MSGLSQSTRITAHAHKRKDQQTCWAEFWGDVFLFSHFTASNHTELNNRLKIKSPHHTNICKPCLRNQTQQYRLYSGLPHGQSSTPRLSKIQTFLRRGFRTKSKQKDEIIEEVTLKTRPSLWKPFLFTFMVGGVSFSGAAIWQYESMRTAIQDNLHGIREKLSPSYYGKAGEFRQKIHHYWNRFSPSERLVIGIMAMNTAVWGLWKVPGLRGLMMRYFVSSPVSPAPCLSMIGSTFSHFSLLHLGVNMYVLWSFTPAIMQLLGREQFLALYITGGTVAAFASMAFKVVTRSTVISIGASGAVLTVLGAVCMHYPDAQLAIAFVDQIIPHSFSASAGIKGLVLFDTLGVLFRWKFFDHAAHLGGVLFGIWYVTYGHKLIWKNREKMIKIWHQARGKP